MSDLKGFSCYEKRIAELEAENERLRKALRQIKKQHPPGGEAYIAAQALAEKDDELD